MFKLLLAAVISLIVGVVLGAAAMLFVYPFIFPPPVLNEQVQNIKVKTIVAKGTFVDHSPSDTIHWGKGGATIYKQQSQFEVFLNKHFQVGPGPAFHVYLSEQANINSKHAFNSSTHFDLGSLKSFKGSQIYTVSNKIDMSKIKSVVIWCKSFGVLITSANLHVKM